MSDEQTRLEDIASHFSSKEGFNGQLGRYDFRSVQPHFVGSTCLELGSADGQLTTMLRAVFASVTSVDGSEEFCRQLQAELGDQPPHRIECGLFESYEPSSSYDTIIINRVLEHLTDPVVVLRRARQWLSDQGRLIAVVPNAMSFHRLLGVKMGLLEHPEALNERDRQIGHRRVYTWALLLEHLREADWEVEVQGGVYFKMVSNDQIDQYYTDEMQEGCFLLGQDFPEHAAEIYAVCRPADR